MPPASWSARWGALVFGRLGDLVGRKYTFLVTILIMGASTFLVGLLPGSATLGIAAPIILIGLRLLQGLALGGEYGGAAPTSPNMRRKAVVVSTRRGSRRLPRSACSCRS